MSVRLPPLLVCRRRIPPAADKTAEALSPRSRRMRRYSYEPVEAVATPRTPGTPAIRHRVPSHFVSPRSTPAPKSAGRASGPPRRLRTGIQYKLDERRRHALLSEGHVESPPRSHSLQSAEDRMEAEERARKEGRLFTPLMQQRLAASAAESGASTRRRPRLKEVAQRVMRQLAMMRMGAMFEGYQLQTKWMQIVAHASFFTFFFKRKRELAIVRTDRELWTVGMMASLHAAIRMQVRSRRRAKGHKGQPHFVFFAGRAGGRSVCLCVCVCVW